MSEEELDINDLELFKRNLKSATNQALCQIILSYRYLGIYKEQTVICMEELSFRRSNGDDFIYEDFIDKLLKDLPEIRMNLKDILNIKIGGIKF